jgi:protoporphyrinogen/coproporphyrinogen III oxidase
VAEARDSERLRDAVIVGAGIGGLAAAWDLRDLDVVVLEASERVGGRVRSEPRGRYWLNLGAHVFSGPGSATWRVAKDVGVELAKVPGELVAVELNGRIVAGGRPELYPFRLPLELRERLALMRAWFRLRRAATAYERAATPRPRESPAETRARILSFGDDRTFASWLGPVPRNVDALFRATVTRSTAEPEEVAFGHGAGYFSLVWNAEKGLSRNIVGGPQLLIDGMAAGIPGGVTKGAAVRAVSSEGDLVRVRYEREGYEHDLLARHVVLATKAFDAARIAEGLPAETRSALEGIPYGASVVMAIMTGETAPMPWDGIYALATPDRAFSMLFNTANVLRPRSATREPGGSFMVYRSGHGALNLLERSDSDVEAVFLGDLYAVYPDARGIVTETMLLRLPHMLPYVAPGRAALQPALERPLGRLHLVGDYLGGEYAESAIESGQAAAAAIRDDLSP